MGSKVLKFLDEALGRKRPAANDTGSDSKRQRLLPLYLHLDHGHREAREQLLWKLGDGGAQPAAVARAFCQPLVQQPQQLEREAGRVQKELERQVEQHRDLLSAPNTSTLVKLEVRVTLPHRSSLFYDDPLWDLSAPRAACEAYVAQLCNELGLDWHAHTLITRKMRDALDAAGRDYAAGKAQVVSLPRGGGIVRPTPSRLPQVAVMTDGQKQQLRNHFAAAQAAKSGGGQSPLLSPGHLQAQPSPGQQEQAESKGSLPLPVGHAPKLEAAAEAAVGGSGYKVEQATAGGSGLKVEQAAAGDSGYKVEQAGSEQTSGQDMPDMPDE